MPGHTGLYQGSLIHLSLKENIIANEIKIYTTFKFMDKKRHQKDQFDFQMRSKLACMNFTVPFFNPSIFMFIDLSTNYL